MIPVLAIDGPSGAGKSQLARLLADKLAWHLLDSGAMYRVLAYVAQSQGVLIDRSSDDLIELAQALPVRFQGREVIFKNQDIEEAIRTEVVADAASKVAAMPVVRQALLSRQRQFAKPPGLIAEGRDMGSTVFPEAIGKIFLTAKATFRADRRYRQLKEKGIDVSLGDISREMTVRDQRDGHRAVAPLVRAEDAYLLDSSDLSIDQVLHRSLDYLHAKLGT